MEIIINGKIVDKMPVKSGVSVKGEWKSQVFIIENKDGDKFPVRVFGEENIDKFKLEQGVFASLTCILKASEWQGKYYLSLDCIHAIVSGYAKNVQVNEVEKPKYDAPVRQVQKEEPKEQKTTQVSDLPF